MLSDFLDTTGDRADFEDALKIASGKHDLVGIRVYDRREAEMPDVGIVELRAAETGERVWVDTSSKTVRDHYASSWRHTESVVEAALRRSRVDSVAVATGEDYVASLMKLFRRR